MIIEWRTKVFPRFLTVGCFFVIFFYWMIVAGAKPVESGSEPAKIDPVFGAVELSAKAAFVWDVNAHKALFSKNENWPLPLASLTKVMTVVTAEDLAWDMKTVSINSSDLSPEGDSGLRVASTWKTEDLVDYLLMVSSNDGAKALAESAGAWNTNLPIDQGQSAARSRFISRMNSLSKEIGLENSVFFNEHGLDRGKEKGGAYGTAKDMALLFEYALKRYPDVFEATKFQELTFADTDNFRYKAVNTNIAASLIPGLYASKTGFTDLAGGNLVVAYDAGLGRPIVISVLGSTQEGRFDDVIKLVDATMKYIKDSR